jgi:hypothetical protein
MSQRESALRNAGINLTQPISGVGTSNNDSLASQEFRGASPTYFSGYGEFTPISVRSNTVLKNADVERD